MRLVCTLSVLLLATVQSAASAPREITGAGFRYYVLSLYWLPTLCIESPDSDECRGSTRNGFIVHGLWPVLDFKSPTRCGGAGVLSDSLVDSLKDLLPTRRLVEREWNVYGTCTGQAPEGYFTLLRQAYDSVRVPRVLGGGGGQTLNLGQIIKAFTNADHGLPAQAIVLTCSDNPARLREIRICLAKNLASNYCSGETLGAVCRVPSIEVPAGP
jgi:ribonuclease T2